MGGDNGNRTHHTDLARISRPLGTCAPKAVNRQSLCYWDLNPNEVVQDHSCCHLHHSTVVEVRFELTKPKRLIYSQVPLSTWVLHSTTLRHSSA